MTVLRRTTTTTRTLDDGAVEVTTEELVPQLLTAVEAARALNLSRDTFDRIVRPEIRTVHRGRLVLVPVTELQKWIERNAATPLKGRR